MYERTVTFIIIEMEADCKQLLKKAVKSAKINGKYSCKVRNRAESVRYAFGAARGSR